MTIGLRQGDAMSPVLFHSMLDVKDSSMRNECTRSSYVSKENFLEDC